MVEYTENDYKEMYGKINDKPEVIAMAKCRCVVCNRCVTGCAKCISQCTGCPCKSTYSDTEWETIGW